MSVATEQLKEHWGERSPLLRVRTEAEYDQAMERVNELLDEVGEDGSHPLYDLLDTLSTLVHGYEERHHPIPDCSGAEVLQFLMEKHGLTQSELPEVGSLGVVSEVLGGKRELNVRQMRALSERFGVSPAVFF
jgi:HTH-type transcriptional regulator/antitoxin HigA